MPEITSKNFILGALAGVLAVYLYNRVMRMTANKGGNGA